jgi:hypothetical protein
LNLSIKIFAQTNSVARIDNPTGITINAGPGRTIKIMPIKRIVPPISAIKMRRICFRELNLIN